VDVPDLVGLFIRPLEQVGIPYMVTGGVAAVIDRLAVMSVPMREL